MTNPIIKLVPPPADDSRDDRVIAQAITILERRMAHTQGRVPFGSPEAVKNYLRLRIGDAPTERFAMLYLDAQNRLIHYEVLFTGTLTQTSVYPREVVVSALKHGAAAVVLAHNHPSGTVHPSRADEALTQTLKAALALVDVRVLDHVIVTSHNALSMAEQGLL